MKLKIGVAICPWHFILWHFVAHPIEWYPPTIIKVCNCKRGLALKVSAMAMALSYGQVSFGPHLIIFALMGWNQLNC